MSHVFWWDCCKLDNKTDASHHGKSCYRTVKCFHKETDARSKLATRLLKGGTIRLMQVITTRSSKLLQGNRCKFLQQVYHKFLQRDQGLSQDWCTLSQDCFKLLQMRDYRMYIMLAKSQEEFNFLLFKKWWWHHNIFFDIQSRSAMCMGLPSYGYSRRECHAALPIASLWYNIWYLWKFSMISLIWYQHVNCNFNAAFIPGCCLSLCHSDDDIFA